MIITLDKIKKILVVGILSAVVINLIINHVKLYKSTPENSVEKLISDIDTVNRSPHRIYSELSAIESNKISEDAANAIYMRYGMGYLTEDEFVEELKKGKVRAEKVYKASKDKCEQCLDYVRIGMKAANEYGVKTWESRIKYVEEQISGAKKEGKLEELRRACLEYAAKWFIEKYSCLEIKEERVNLSEAVNNKADNKNQVKDSNNRSNNE